jgi:hypothetical protein
MDPLGILGLRMRKSPPPPRPHSPWGSFKHARNDVFMYKDVHFDVTYDFLYLAMCIRDNVLHQ